ncbi:MAG: TraB domain-containing protein, partial [Desulfobacterales bacterium]|nr:TraB domain-containing protein [Desulfobacterales bacterium]
MTDHDNIHRLTHDGREIILIGTAHVSKESADLVRTTIETEKPDTVCVELCESRWQSIQQKSRWREMDIVKVVKEKKAFLLLSNLILASFQRRIADKMDIQPGQEMITAIETADAVGARTWLADRDIRTTLARTWRSMTLWGKVKLLFQLLLSLGEVDDLKEEDIERMKQEDVLNALLNEIGASQPAIREILIDERDRYLAQRIKSAPGEKIVAVVGAGHVPGIKACWAQDIDLAALDVLPPRSLLAGSLKWIIPAIIIMLFGWGFYAGGSEAGSDMIMWWVAANGL